VVATDVDHEERLFAAIKAPGLGDEDKVRCIEEKVNEATGRTNGMIVFETKGDVRITPKEGGGHLIILNKDTLVDVDKSWEDQVFKAIEDPSARVTDSPLAKALARVDHNAHAWVSAILAESARSELTEVPGADGLDSVNAAIDLGDGLALDLDLGFAEADKAEAFRTAATTMLEEVKPQADQLGVPKELLDSVAIAGEGPQVTAKAKIGKDALPQVLGAMGGLMAP
jgi:hypothetical protein